MTSELSNALNPNIVTARRHRLQNAPNTVQQPPQLPVGNVPHRSELESAIAEPPQPLPVAPVYTQASRPGVNPVQALLRVFSATKEAAEVERKRRLAWEREQEEKYAQRQADMEQQMHEMREEISLLKAYISLHPPPNDSPAFPVAHTDPAPHSADSIPPIINEPAARRPAAPLTPVSLPAATPMTPISGLPYQPPPFTEGASSQPLTHAHVFQHSRSENVQYLDVQDAGASTSVSPAPTTQSNEHSQPSTSTSALTTKKRRSRTSKSERADASSSDESSGSPVGDRPLKRVNGHDGRCLTIHHAMRSHIIRMMQLQDDKHLPDSHGETEELGADDPVRFVWDKTPKQSSHNADMRARVVADLKANRRLYKYVPEKDFSKKNLDTVFDQAFTTMRQKFRVQRDVDAALKLKQREEQKARSARRSGRKKLKLTNRIDTRKRLTDFAHTTFDGALQQDCMSSEESGEEFVDADGRERMPVLRVRGPSWRSLRLQRFYATLDQEERVDRAQKPKRGVGRRERYLGLNKDALLLPPKGVSSWMISHRWIDFLQLSHPELLQSLKSLVVDPPGFDWAQFCGLGAESEDDAELGEPDQYIPRSDASYSLQYALTPMS